MTGLVAVFGLCAIAPAASAGVSPTTVVGASRDLHIDVVGQVPGHCGFAGAAPTTQTLGDLTHAGAASLPFTVDCNTAFRVRVASANGGLAGPAAADSFANQLDYSLELKVGTDRGGLDQTCMASALKGAAGGCAFWGAAAGQGLSSGDGVAINAPASLQFDWSQSAKRLVAGKYTDTLTIVVEARS